MPTLAKLQSSEYSAVLGWLLDALRPCSMARAVRGGCTPASSSAACCMAALARSVRGNGAVAAVLGFPLRESCSSGAMSAHVRDVERRTFPKQFVAAPVR